MHRIIANLLFYDARKHGHHGRCLREGLVECNLLAGDRLEPSGLLPDVGLFQSLKLPARVLFWRASCETMCQHRCPLFAQCIGVSLVSSVCVDLLHTLHLGPMLIWCREAMWFLLLAKIWGSLEGSEGEAIRVALMSLKGELQRWYESKPMAEITKLSNLTMKMIGSKNDRKLKVKAMECYGFMFFLLHCLRKYRASLGGGADLYINSGVCLADYVALLKGAPVNLPLETQQGMRKDKSNKPWEVIVSFESIANTGPGIPFGGCLQEENLCACSLSFCWAPLRSPVSFGARSSQCISCLDLFVLPFLQRKWWSCGPSTWC